MTRLPIPQFPIRILVRAPLFLPLSVVCPIRTTDEVYGMLAPIRFLPMYLPLPPLLQSVLGWYTWIAFHLIGSRKYYPVCSARTFLLSYGGRFVVAGCFD